MAKITLPIITSGYNLTKLNEALQQIQDEFNDKVLYRDNPVGEDNALSSDIDFDSQRILNLPEPLSESEPVRKSEWDSTVGAAEDARDAAQEAQAETEELLLSRGDLRNTGVYQVGFDYLVSDIFEASTGDWYLTLKPFTSTVEATDIASTNVRIWQGLTSVDSVLFGTFANALSRGDVAAGALIIVSDRDDALYDYTSGETDNGIDIRDHDTLPLQVKLRIGDTAKALQAGSTGSSDDAPTIQRMLAESQLVEISDSQIDSTVNITRSSRIKGTAPQTTVSVPAVAATPAFSAAGIGSVDRKGVTLENLNLDGGDGVAVSVTTVSPFNMRDVRLNTGKGAFTMSASFYGAARDMLFLDSGVDFYNVNNYDIVGTDSNGSKAISSGRYIATDYAFNLDLCVNVSFQQMTHEIWPCGVFDLKDCKGIVFFRTWWEGNSGTNTIRMENTSDVLFSGGKQDFTTNPGDNFILVENDYISPARVIDTSITVENASITSSQSASNTPVYVKTSSTPGAFKAYLNFRGSTLAAGFLRNPDLNTEVTISNMLLSSNVQTTDTKKGLIARDTMDVSKGQANSWSKGNANLQWDFATLGADWSELTATGSTIGTVTSIPTGQAITGTRALNFSVPGAATATFERIMSELGPVTIDGQTYLMVAKIFSDVDCSVKMRLKNSPGVQVDDLFVADIGGSDWRVILLKSNSDNTWSLSQAGNSKMSLEFTTTAATEIYIDRADFEMKLGDHFLP